MTIIKNKNSSFISLVTNVSKTILSSSLSFVVVAGLIIHVPYIDHELQKKYLGTTEDYKDNAKAQEIEQRALELKDWLKKQGMQDFGLTFAASKLFDFFPYDSHTDVTFAMNRFSVKAINYPIIHLARTTNYHGNRWDTISQIIDNYKKTKTTSEQDIKVLDSYFRYYKNNDQLFRKLDVTLFSMPSFFTTAEQNLHLDFTFFHEASHLAIPRQKISNCVIEATQGFNIESGNIKSYEKNAGEIYADISGVLLLIKRHNLSQSQALEFIEKLAYGRQEDQNIALILAKDKKQAIHHDTEAALSMLYKYASKNWDKTTNLTIDQIHTLSLLMTKNAVTIQYLIINYREIKRAKEQGLYKSMLEMYIPKNQINKMTPKEITNEFNSLINAFVYSNPLNEVPKIYKTYYKNSPSLESAPAITQTSSDRLRKRL